MSQNNNSKPQHSPNFPPLLLDIKGGTGPASALFINTIPKPTPQQPSDAIVKIKAFGLNRMDLLQRLGHYPIPPHAPRTLGVEFSGVVESLGEDPEQEFKVGDEVFGLAYGGAFPTLLLEKKNIPGGEES